MKCTRWSFDTVSVKAACLSDFCSSIRITPSSHRQNIRLFLHCLQQHNNNNNTQIYRLLYLKLQRHHYWCLKFRVFNHWQQQHTVLFSCMTLTTIKWTIHIEWSNSNNWIKRCLQKWRNRVLWSLVHCSMSDSVIVIFSVLTSAHSHHPWICTLT